MTQPDTFVGIDLTDAYANAPRAVDVAIIDANTGNVDFDHFNWLKKMDGAWPAVAHIVRKFQREKTVFVVDGPQALAMPQNNTRGVEQYLGTPGHTGWQMPVPRARPFAGYIRTSIEFFNALVAEGFILAELNGAAPLEANLFEAYPGAVWRCWHDAPAPLQPKKTVVGRQQRMTILQSLNLIINNLPLLTHDQNDAANPVRPGRCIAGMFSALALGWLGLGVLLEPGVGFGCYFRAASARTI